MEFFRSFIALLNALGKSSKYIAWRLIPSCTAPAAKSAVPSISLTIGSGNTTKAKPAFIRIDLFPHFHSFLVAPTLFVAVLTELAISTRSLLISLMDVVNALNSSVFTLTHSRTLQNKAYAKEKLIRKTGLLASRIWIVCIEFFN